MAYIEPSERVGKMADAVIRLRAYPDFQLLVDVLCSDLVDKQSQILSGLDGTELQRTIGAAIELKRVLGDVYDSRMTIEKLNSLSMARVQRERQQFISA